MLSPWPIEGSCLFRDSSVEGWSPWVTSCLWHGQQRDPGKMVLQSGKWDPGDKRLHPGTLWLHVQLNSVHLVLCARGDAVHG